MDRLLGVEETAKRLNVKPARVYDLSAAGLLPTVRLGRHIRFSAEALEQFIRNGGRAYPKREPEPLKRGGNRRGK